MKSQILQLKQDATCKAFIWSKSFKSLVLLNREMYNQILKMIENH